MNDDEVILTPEESRICTWVGRKRFENARRLDRNPGLGPPHTTADHDIRGAHCEFAASLILNVSCRPTIGEISAPDVGGFIEVRSTDIETGRLIVKPGDDDLAPFVLIVANMEQLHFRAAGWLYGNEAKGFPLLTDFGDPAHFVPQGALSSVATLRALIAAPYAGHFQRWEESNDDQRIG